MAPLTRSRAGEGDVQGPMNAEYYRTARERRAHRVRSHQHQPAGQGLRLHPWHLHGRAGQRLAPGDRRRACRNGGRDLLPTLACRSDQPPVPATRMVACPSPLLPSAAEGASLHREPGSQPMVAPRALESSGNRRGSSPITVHAADLRRSGPGSTGWRFTPPMATSWNSSSARNTNQRTDASMAAAIENRVRLTVGGRGGRRGRLGQRKTRWHPPIPGQPGQRHGRSDGRFGRRRAGDL